MPKKLWVFRVSGGAPFRVRAKGNPHMIHDGGPEVVLKCLCTEEQAEDVERQMLEHGCTVVKHASGETDEQKVERKNLLELLGGDRCFPCERCPNCAWFDPHIESLCGAGLAFGKPGWEEAAIQGAMTNAKHRSDFKECPLQEGKIR